MFHGVSIGPDDFRGFYGDRTVKTSRGCVGTRAPVGGFRLVRHQMLVYVFSLLALPAFPARAGPCEEVPVAGAEARDAAPALAACLNDPGSGPRVAIPAGTYLLKTPLVISRTVAFRPTGLDDGAPRCTAADRRCVIFKIAIDIKDIPSGRMPVEIRAPGVAFHHLVIAGAGQSDPARCRNIPTRPGGGGVRVAAPGFRFERSMVRNVTCYTAMELVKGADRAAIVASTFAANGDHGPGHEISDGLTIHQSMGTRVSSNLFVDNTDVQLIFGGCKGCRVTGNRFRHGGNYGGSSFAELMLHSWKDETDGDYAGTVVSNNEIDCGPGRHCGFGIMLGANPWYRGHASGGRLAGNHVRNAMIGLNVDGLTGPMEVRNIVVDRSGGTFPSSCGLHHWPAVNVAAASRPLVRGMDLAKAGREETSGCILNNERPNVPSD